MHPILFKLGPVTIYSYGMMLFLGAVVCLYLLSKEAVLKGYDKDTILDLGFVILFSGLLGARLLYVVLNRDYYFSNLLEIFMLHHGGLAVLGGIVFGVAGGLIFTKHKKLPFFKIVDLIVPYIALGHSLGRIGCFLNGCCYGISCKFGFYSLAQGDYLFPAQLLSSFLMLVLYVILRIKQSRPHIKGEVFFSYIIYSSFFRFFEEFLRNDSPKCFLTLTMFQLICLFFLVIGVLGVFSLKWKLKNSK